MTCESHGERVGYPINIGRTEELEWKRFIISDLGLKAVERRFSLIDSNLTVLVYRSVMGTGRVSGVVVVV